MFNTENWQDYRGKGEGVLIHLDTTKMHELPIREPLDAEGNPVLEPNYETGTYGFMQCVNAKTLLSTFRNRRRYLLFGTRYQGTVEEFRGRFLIIGYMRLDKSLEVRKRYSHRWVEQAAGSKSPEWLEMEECYAFYSEEMNFYSPQDSFELSEDLMKGWGYKGKITKQMKLTFSEERLQQILEHFHAKQPRNPDYVTAVKNVEAELETVRAKEQEQDKPEW